MLISDFTKSLESQWAILLGQIVGLTGGGNGTAKRLAGVVFIIRILGAILAYGSQVLLARWMGGHEFGVYVYVWTWVLLLGCCVDLGFGSAAQRLIRNIPNDGKPLFCAAFCPEVTDCRLERRSSLAGFARQLSGSFSRDYRATSLSLSILPAQHCQRLP